MKKLIILILALIPFIFSCKKEKDPNSEIREIAWNSLSEQAKSTVTIDWDQALVSESTYNQKSVYAVSFKTSDDLLLGQWVAAERYGPFEKTLLMNIILKN